MLDFVQFESESDRLLSCDHGINMLPYTYVPLYMGSAPNVPLPAIHGMLWYQ